MDWKQSQQQRNNKFPQFLNSNNLIKKIKLNFITIPDSRVLSGGIQTTVGKFGFVSV